MKNYLESLILAFFRHFFRFCLLNSPTAPMLCHNSDLCGRGAVLTTFLSVFKRTNEFMDIDMPNAVSIVESFI